ncbi:MAG TPA: prepilin-type N-terminal cleavage/methylation domain-containing protein, partial [Candidatus Acidoferrales bacterium]|nr:prepilin-type N-terminal cleavage/methylation domain-containing protein [Candidatus Acidoferrales bacterium]
MTQAQEYPDSRELAARALRNDSGYSLVELIFAVVISLILTAIAVPAVGSVLNNYRLQGAVANATWAIQSTRYQALMAGYPYQVVFTKASSQYQIQNLPTGATTYANV